ncbi:MAG: ATP-grasp domain-containing protein [Candidatus Odinarchaeia archaeon]
MGYLTVVVTGAGAPGIKGTLYSLNNNWENKKVKTIGVDMKDQVVGRFLCDKFYKIPPGESDDFIPELMKICKKENVDVILPQVTRELEPLAKCKNEFNEIGVKIAVSDLKSITNANNKYKLIKIAEKAGMPTSKAYLVEKWSDLEEAAEELGFPFVVKPPISSGMRGFRVVLKEVDLKHDFYRNKPDNTKISFEQLYHILGEKFPPLMVMEYLPGDEYSVDILSNEVEVKAVIPRRRDYIRSGITFNGTVIKKNELIHYSEVLSSKLGLKYAFGLQFKEDTHGTVKIIESNPRIQGTMVLSTLSGANIIYGAVKIALGEDVPDFNIKWGTKIFRYWGGIIINDKVVKI